MDENKEYRKGLWTEEEDRILMDYIRVHGKGKWSRIAKVTGLKRCGKSCRLRWMNYLSPGVKRGNFSEEENDLIIRLHKLLGNRWSLIAGRVPGRTDNQVKNHWNTHLSKKLGVNKGQPSKSKPNSNSSSSSLQTSRRGLQMQKVMMSGAGGGGGTPDSSEYCSLNVPAAAATTSCHEQKEGGSVAVAARGRDDDDDEYEKAFRWFCYDDLKSPPPPLPSSSTTSVNHHHVMQLLDDEALDCGWHEHDL